MTPDQLPAGLPMDDKIEAWRHGLLRLVLQHARAYADNSDPAKTEAAYVAICDYLRTTPEGFVLMPTKLSRAMEAVLENEKGAYQTGDDLYADLIAASQESAALKEQNKC
jgi:hypothetical protein